MRRYQVEKLKEDTRQYYLIRDTESFAIVREPSKYLMFRTRTGLSPNTVRQEARSLSFYLNFLEEEQTDISGILLLSYDRQFTHFSEYLQYLKAGRHSEKGAVPKNATCNAYLAAVFRYCRFLKDTGISTELPKVLLERSVSFTTPYGRRMYEKYLTFPGYLRKEYSQGKSTKRDKILTLLSACTNMRDRLLLLFMAETGFRIGEILGIRLSKDVDLSGKKVRVRFRSDNTNEARAKNAEERIAMISDVTAGVLAVYLSEYAPLLEKQDYLFILLSGKNKGQPLGAGAVYAMLNYLEAKTGIAVTPHMLRHYFANERRKDGWGIELISKALGHRNLATTEKYLHVENEEFSDASRAYFEKNRIDLDIGALL